MEYLRYNYRGGGGRSPNKAIKLTPSALSRCVSQCCCGPSAQLIAVVRRTLWAGEVTEYGSPVEQHSATRCPAAAHYRRRGTGAPARGRPVPTVGRPPGPGGGRRWLGQLDVPPRLRNVGAFAQRSRV